MRAPLLLAVCLVAATPDLAGAQTKLSTKADPNAIETRYFTAIDGLMDGNADVILKEVRQGKTLKEAFPRHLLSRRQGLRPQGPFRRQSRGQRPDAQRHHASLGDKKPVTVKLTRKQTGDTFDFRGQITVGTNLTEVASSENSDISEKEFKDSQVVDDGINPAPKDFSDVSPESVGVRLKLDAALDFLKSLKGQDVEVATNSLGVTCDALRSGVQTINLAVDPDRARRSDRQGQGDAGRGRGGMDHRNCGDGAHDSCVGRRLRRGRQAQPRQARVAVSNVLAKALSAKPAGASWSTTTGKVKLSFKRPSPIYPALELTDTVEVTGAGGPDKPGGSDKVMLWIGNPVTITADESAGGKLILSNESAGEEEGDQKDDSGIGRGAGQRIKGPALGRRQVGVEVAFFHLPRLRGRSPRSGG